MKHRALIGISDPLDVLDEGEVQDQNTPQEASKRNPEVLPVADLVLGEVVAVGQEAGRVL